MTLQSALARSGAPDRESSAALPSSSSPMPNPVWRPSTRYADQQMSWQTRMFGIGGVAMIALLIAGATLITWSASQVVQAPANLSVFDVEPPAAPPERPNEIPPGPEQEKRGRPLPKPERPRIEVPEIQLTSDNPIKLPTIDPAPDISPPAKNTTAPESKPLPPAPLVSTGKPTWEGLVLGALNKRKRYPPWSMARHEQGVPWIRFVIDRGGKVVSSQLERSSGFSDLDREAVALPKRASPLPRPPEDIRGETIELVVPVEFFMR